jgi:NTE family protein
MRVGLVLGAGGVKGGAWITGGLSALASQTGWDPASAEFIVGTSAGSMMGALLAAGVPPWFMVSHSAGEALPAIEGAPEPDESTRAAGAVFHRKQGLLPRPFGSPRLAFSTLRNPLAFTPGTVAAGWLPRGFIDTEPLRNTIRQVVPSGWTRHPNFWAVATDYQTGKRVPFGRAGSPEAELADAVAASCAVPSFFEPVVIGGREYIDGGVSSVSNLDLLRGRGLDLVICLNPMSSRAPAGSMSQRVMALWRSNMGRRLGMEARKVRESGTEVVLIQPLAEDLAAMGANWMSARGRQRVINLARQTVSRQLAAPGVAELLADLPQGDPGRTRRPRSPEQRKAILSQLLTGRGELEERPA